MPKNSSTTQAKQTLRKTIISNGMQSGRNQFSRSDRSLEAYRTGARVIRNNASANTSTLQIKF